MTHNTQTARGLRHQPDSTLSKLIPASSARTCIADYAGSPNLAPLLVHGDALAVLRQLADDGIDCVMTSPPYWGMRDYGEGDLGREPDYRDYISNLAAVCAEIQRVLKPTGSFWINIGDAYRKKCLLGIPWRLAFELTDHQGWILRNSVIWHKVKSGMDHTKDRLGSVHEHLFHFVKSARGYYYDVDAIRAKPRGSKVVNGAIVSGTGVSGVRYRRQIELSTALTDLEKQSAGAALDTALDEIRAGTIADFRMILRGQQRTTHSDNPRVSGRARELIRNGFCILRYHPNGSKPSDVWDILPEDSHHRDAHFAPYPEDLCRIPILATCPARGLVLDPFCGTGTTLVTARRLNRKAVGIDISRPYLEHAARRILA